MFVGIGRSLHLEVLAAAEREAAKARLTGGQVRPAPRQVHGVLHDVPWRRGAEGRERRRGDDQDEAHDPVRRLGPDGLQVRSRRALALTVTLKLASIAVVTSLAVPVLVVPLY